MSNFMTPLKLEATNKSIGGRPVYKITEKFSLSLCGKGYGIYVDVPEGFDTDFASVPRLLWFIYHPDGGAAKAAVLHDFMYRKRCNFSRIIADAVYLDAMRLLGVPFWKRYTMYLGVRLFGWLSFKKRF